MKKKLVRYLALSSVAIGVAFYCPSEAMANTEGVSRIEGTNRFQTAANISQATYDSADTVVIVNARGFADALAGAPLAYQHEAPILLTQGNRLHSSISKEIERLGADNAIILGGEAAVTASISDELQKLGLNIQRIAGDNRFETAEKIADNLGEFISSDKAVVVDGFEFADAMSVAPFAAKEGMPIYLTRSNTLSSESRLNEFSKTYIIGGENAVSPAVESKLNNPKRLAGPNRYATNLTVLDYFGVDSETLFISTGLDYVDALTGSILAAQNNSGVALVRGSVSSDLKTFINNQQYGLSVFGGEAVVSRSLFNELGNLLSDRSLPDNNDDSENTKESADENDPYFLNIDVLNTEMLALINEERAEVGVDPLSYDPALAEGTAIRADEILSEDDLRVNGVAHARPDGSPFTTAFEYLPKNGQLMLGENLAQNWIGSNQGLRNSEEVLAKQFFKQYYNSPGHYQNMINADYTGFATDVRIADNGKTFNVQIFTLDRSSLEN